MKRVQPYPCTKCGACCRHVKGVLPSKPDGSCKFLDGTRCKIYENRPLVCRIDIGIDMGLTKYKDNVAACNKLQEKHGIDESYRVGQSS